MSASATHPLSSPGPAGPLSEPARVDLGGWADLTGEDGLGTVAMSSKTTLARQIPFTRPGLTAREQQAVQDVRPAAQPGGAEDLDALLEQSLAHLLDVRHVLLTASWEAALQLTARVLSWGPGDEVILPSFASVSLATAILDRGARPVFAEIDEATWTLDPVDVASRIDVQTRAIIPVHYAGQSCDLALLSHIARRFDIAIVEDASQAVGAKFAGRWLGTRGTIGCLRFQASLDSASCEVGVWVTNDPQLALKAEELHGADARCSLPAAAPLKGAVGGVVSDALAACVQQQLAQLDETRRLCRAVWWRYQDLLSDLAQSGQVILPWIDSQMRSNWQTYAFRLTDATRRDALIDFLNGRGIQACAHFTPLHSSPLATGRPADLPITDRVSKSLVRLPIYPDLTLEAQEYVVEALLDFFRRPSKPRPPRLNRDT